MNSIPAVEVCFSPILFNDIKIKTNFIVVVVDIFRATTTIVAAIEYGIKTIIPLSSEQELRAYKANGYYVAAEHEGKKLDFADIDNSAFNFMNPIFIGKEIAYSTTNGTKTIEIGSANNQEVIIGSFTNIDAVTRYLLEKKKNVVVLCSGYKNRFCKEDALFSGALAQKLLASGHYDSFCDATMVSIDMWEQAKDNLIDYLKPSDHYRRMERRNIDDVIPYSLTLNSCSVVPYYDAERKMIQKK